MIVCVLQKNVPKTSEVSMFFEPLWNSFLNLCFCSQCFWSMQIVLQKCHCDRCMIWLQQWQIHFRTLQWHVLVRLRVLVPPYDTGYTIAAPPICRYDTYIYICTHICGLIPYSIYYVIDPLHLLKENMKMPLWSKTNRHLNKQWNKLLYQSEVSSSLRITCFTNQGNLASYQWQGHH